MLLLYIVSAIVAGALVILSLLGADHSGDSEVSADHEVQVDHDLTSEHDSSDDILHGPWLPFLSLRFWTYLFAGFGTTGLLLTFVTKTPEPMTTIIALLVGLGCGFAVSLILRLLQASESSSNAKEADMLGKEAQVLVAIRGATPGRIRLSLRGDLIDFMAVAPDGETIEPGVSVVVLEIEGDRAHVARRDAILGSDTLELGQGK